MEQGIYALPGCTQRPLNEETLARFSTEAAARYAGLRPCKCCHPNRLMPDSGLSLAAFDALRRALEAQPERLNSVAALAEASGLSALQLDSLFRDHAHCTVSHWLNRTRVRMAAQQLLNSRAPLNEIADRHGFADVGSFQGLFLHHMRMSAGEYRALPGGDRFALALPAGYRAQEVLAYHGRDADSPCERREGMRLCKALLSSEGPLVLQIDLGESAGWASCRVHSDKKLCPSSFAELQHAALSMLGLDADVERFEAQHPALVGGRRGMRLPRVAKAFEALCWAITGQQINLSFASALRRELLQLAGVPVGSMRAHPSAALLARLEPAALISRRFSRSKAAYLLNAAQAIQSGGLALDELLSGSAIAAEQALTAQHGIGIWTARYVLMRSGFADAAPVGDSGLSTALKRLHALPQRPDAQHTARLMHRYAPFRALASAHLWASL